MRGARSGFLLFKVSVSGELFRISPGFRWVLIQIYLFVALSRARLWQGLLLMSLTLGGLSAAQAAIPTSERMVLTNLYASTNGASWANKTNWNGPVGTECTWRGVVCDATQTHVLGIDLGSNNLVGTLPLLSGLTNLQGFFVSQNRLTGSIPSLNGLASLQRFVAWGNRLTGSIPSLSGLTNLQVLSVSVNQLTGTIPSLSGLTNFQTLDVQGNQLTGAIPSLSGLTALQNIFVNNNQLTGSIPSLSGLTSLLHFYAYDNQLTGPIPAAPASLSAGQSNLCNNSLVSSGNPAIDAAWVTATGRDWLACQNMKIYSVTPSSATLNVSQDFTVTGSNLTSGMGFSVPDCAPSSAEVGAGTATKRTFRCTPSGTTGAKIGVVKMVPGGSQLHSFQVNVSPNLIPDYKTFPIPLPAKPLSDTPTEDRLIVVTHGWNSDTEAWPNELVRSICSTLLRRSVALSDLNTDIATGKVNTVTGPDRWCKVGKWLVASYNWAPDASLSSFPPRFPTEATANAVLAGRNLAAYIGGKKYVHLIGHSAGSAFVNAVAIQLKAQASAPYVHSTFLDAYCVNSGSCSYGKNSDKAEQYVDNRFSQDIDEFNPTGPNQTNVTLPNALNFDVTKLDAISNYTAGWGVDGVQYHAFPYKYYIHSAGGALPGWEFALVPAVGIGTNISVGAPWAAWSASNAYLDSFDPVTWSRTTPYPSDWRKGSRCIFDPKMNPKQSPFGCYSQPGIGASSIGIGASNSKMSVAKMATFPSYSTSTMLDSTCSPILSGNLTPGNGTLNLSTCGQPVPQSPGMALLSFVPDQMANGIRFKYRFLTSGAKASLQVYVNDALIYVTTQALDGETLRSSDWIDVVNMETVNQTIRFVVKSSTAADSAVEISDIELSRMTPPAVTGSYLAVASIGDGNGTVSVSGVDCGAGCSNYYPSGTIATITATPAIGSTFAGWSSTCVGTATGANFITSALNANCSVAASFTVASGVNRSTHTGLSAGGTGSITASFSGGGAGCGYTVSNFILLSGGVQPPAGVSFPHGLFDFTIGGCTPGATITMTLTYPQALPAGAVYWKYGPTPTDNAPHWYQLPAAISGNTATFSITDGGLGDDDLTANGTIVDQGGPGWGGAGGASSIPTLSEWGLMLLSSLLALGALVSLRRQRV